MSEITSVFQRYENKYITDKETAKRIAEDLSAYMIPDRHFKYHIMGMYLDTDDYLLIRRSIEKPIYKEKLRLRCYEIPSDEDRVFLEIKKKFNRLGSKRRIDLTCKDAMDYILSKKKPDVTDKSKQIFSEIERAFTIYDLSPKAAISYSRIAFSKKEDDLRITFDSDIFCRTTDLVPSHGIYGERLIDDENFCIMEVKTSLAYPLWFVEILNKYGLKRQPFSKYGNCYRKFILH